ncbi:glucosyl-3-phosphoglycerate synthase [Corynebacterium massiliense]|uniref:Glucosyl-3-phosphoglycerate synthase n=1 Tax=Corynebacterium massiliense DSM 45435 TaxID=1121364 RepID=A0ABY7U6F4_9CORY|nr:glucosyl-3-phosphoglycerate synthase [Corynebacterium massiliense]WCZ32266.1 Glucosyl-3-phosphoglycerate synthase [Corynebacterium massiliense DSM 45435]
MKVSVVIPALNEEATVADVVRACRADGPAEVLVIDADSQDGTARQAAGAGATVVNWRDPLPDIAPRPGKGESLWRGVHAAGGDIVVFVDADLESAEPGMVRSLIAPFADPDVQMVRAAYRRTFEGKPAGGGRVTELTAKPLLRHFFPELNGINQPLGGEYAVRREAAVQVPFVAGYGVESGLLIDFARRFGADAIAQAQLAPRVHRNRPLSQLTQMADVVSGTILARALERPLEDFDLSERPPLATLA